MPFSNRSLTRLQSCHPDLVKLITAVSEGVDHGECQGVHDITVLCGFRDRLQQDQAYTDGTSKLQWPRSKHNQWPSRAIDIAPYPVDWKDNRAFVRLRAYVMKKATEMNIRIRIISWDWPHFELLEEEPEASPVTLRGVG